MFDKNILRCHHFFKNIGKLRLFIAWKGYMKLHASLNMYKYSLSSINQVFSSVFVNKNLLFSDGNHWKMADLFFCPLPTKII